MSDEKQVAVITGAASGIGLALAKACLQRKMHVVMADNSKEKLSQSAANLSSFGGEIIQVDCDVARLSDLQRLADTTMDYFHRVDLLINNAGISGPLAPLWELTEAEIRKVMDINLFGVIHGIKVFLPLMFAQKHRSVIVNMASLYGLVSSSQVAPYSMSKHAIVSLSESLYFDLQNHNKPVDIAVVCPSFANTALLFNSKPEEPNQLYQMMMELLERSRSPEEIADHILREIDNKKFYILPDKEVKHYCEQRVQGIMDQQAPNRHSLEKIMTALSKRA